MIRKIKRAIKWLAIIIVITGLFANENVVSDIIETLIPDGKLVTPENVTVVTDTIKDIVSETDILMMFDESVVGYEKYELTNIQIPEYTGDAYSYMNNNVPYFTYTERECTEKFEFYMPLDYLGRCQTAYANLCTELMPTEDRGDISSVYPSGWEQKKYEGLVDQDWLYNRCHLIAYSLAGENANECNLITGTRYMNIEGMWQFEETVLYYLKDNPDNHVLYRVTPIFVNNELVARGVLMEAYSVEDDGAGVCFNVYCHNVAPGIVIDYATGDSWAEN